MKKYVLYVGANNDTKEVDYGAMRAQLDKNFQGYTLTASLGLWEGVTEKACIVTLFTDKTVDAMRDIVNTLRVELDQYSIILEVSSPEIIFVEI